MMSGTYASRGSAVLLLVVILFAIWHVSVAPLRLLWIENTSIIQSRADLLRQWKQKLALLESDHVSTPSDLVAGFEAHYVSASNPALAGAALQTSIRAMLARHQITLRAAQVLATKRIGSRDSYGVRVQFDGRLKSIYRLMYDLEKHIPFLFVERLLLRRRTIGQPANKTTGEHDRVMATLEVFAMRRPASGTVSKAGD